MPQSGKVVVLDVGLDIKAALFCLHENDLKAAPLWNPQLFDYVGMFTVTDFLQLLKSYSLEGVSLNLETFKIGDFRARFQTPPLICAHPDDSIYETTKTLVKNKIHRIPLIDRKESSTILHVLSYDRVLRFLLNNAPKKRRQFLKSSIEDLRIGTFHNIIKVNPETPMFKILELSVDKKLSSIPIVDKNDVLLEVCSNNDLVTVVRESNIFNCLNKSIMEVISSERCLQNRPRQWYTCTKSEKLLQIVEILTENRVRRVICLEDNKVVGIISMQDILRFLIV